MCGPYLTLDLAIRMKFSRRVYVNYSFIAAPASHQEIFSPLEPLHQTILKSINAENIAIRHRKVNIASGLLLTLHCSTTAHIVPTCHFLVTRLYLFSHRNIYKSYQ